MKMITYKKIVSICLAINVLLLFSNCSKSTNDSQATSSFTWSTGGKNYSATIYKAYKTGYGLAFAPLSIVAGFENTPTFFSKRIDFHLSSFDIGSYTIVSVPNAVNTLQFIDDLGNDMVGKSGTLRITANSNNLLSGDFSVTVSTGSTVTSAMSGSFTNITIVP
jgi:hypothetical protein